MNFLFSLVNPRLAHLDTIQKFLTNKLTTTEIWLIVWKERCPMPYHNTEFAKFKFGCQMSEPIQFLAGFRISARAVLEHVHPPSKFHFFYVGSDRLGLARPHQVALQLLLDVEAMLMSYDQTFLSFLLVPSIAQDPWFSTQVSFVIFTN